MGSSGKGSHLKRSLLARQDAGVGMLGMTSSSANLDYEHHPTSAEPQVARPRSSIRRIIARRKPWTVECLLFGWLMYCTVNTMLGLQCLILHVDFVAPLFAYRWTVLPLA